MKRLLVAAVVVIAAQSGFAARISPDVAEAVRKHGSVRIIVLTRSTAAKDDGIAVVHRFGGSFAGVADQNALDELASDPNVEDVGLDLPVHGADAESLPLIGGNVTQSLGFRGDGVTVAVIDSGFNPDHPDLKNVVLAEQCYCGSNCCPNGKISQSGTGAARDQHGHGTNVTGIIASRGTVAPIGVAPGVKVVAVRVLDKDNRGYISDMIAGLQWVADQHPEVRVVNMSVVSDAEYAGNCAQADAATKAFASLAAKLRERGTLVFACSGNSGSSKGMGAPACAAPMIAVGAVYDSNVGSSTFGCTDATTAADQIACFSESDSQLALLAPGALITSTGLNATTSTFRGTSQATPHVSGAAAVLMSMRPDLPSDAILATLESTGKPIFDARNGVTTPRIDLLAAVLALQEPRPKHRATRH